MVEKSPLGLWRGFLALPNAHPVKTLGIAFLVALTCSVVVSFSAITLKPLQDENRLRASASAMVEMVESLGLPLPTQRWVKRDSGEYVSRDPGTTRELALEEDAAGLGRIEDVIPVFEVHTNEGLALLVLPVRGAGYKSELKGYLALRADLNTVAALVFHQQDETPGMGARITEPAWLALWSGKQVSDADGIIRIDVVKGGGEGPFEVDGISGATRTGRGVGRLMRFWLGPQGYGPYLARLKAEGGV